MIIALLGLLAGSGCIIEADKVYIEFGKEVSVDGPTAGRSGKVVRGVFTGDQIPVRDVLVAIGFDRLGLVWNDHVPTIPVREVGGVRILQISEDAAILLAADGRILGCGVSPQWARTCSRAVRVADEALASGKEVDLVALLRAMRADDDRQLRSEEGSDMVRDEVSTETERCRVGNLASSDGGE